MSMSIEKALDKIADLLTETTDDSNGSIEYSLSVIANALANGGAKELPAVTATDNGDVLTVVDGSWAKAVPSGGGGTMYVNLSGEEVESEYVYTADKTVAEIVDAIEAGSGVVLKYAGDGYAYFYDLYEYDETYVVFTKLYISGSVVHQSKYTILDNGNVSFEESGVEGTPYSH